MVGQRFLNQGLMGKKFKTPIETVRVLGAVQAQDYANAKFALSLRVSKKVHDTDVEQALSDGKILRTHVMRPTWHFVAPEDIRWMQMLTSPRVNTIMGHYSRKLGLTEKILEKGNQIIENALKGENYLTRQELKQILQKKGVSGNVQYLAHLVADAELKALICNGPRKGKQATYALVEERAPKAKEKTMEEALEELARRYFTSHGPATVQDFVWWSGLRVNDAKKGIELAKLKSETIEGLTYHFSKWHSSTPDISNTVLLLPNYDEYTIGYKNSRFWFHPDGLKPTQWGPAFNFSHTLIIEGKITGMWNRETKKNQINLRFKLHRALNSEEKKNLGVEVKKYGEFFGMPTKMSIEK